MTDFPKMLYRKGSKLAWEGRSLDIMIAEDPEAETKAAAAGWRTIEALLSGDNPKTSKRATK